MTQPTRGFELARPTYRDIVLYAPDRAPCAVDLSDNTNRWGVPPVALRRISDNVAALARYPDLYSARLKECLAEYVGVDTSMIVTGCGSDDVLDSAVRAFAEPGELLSMPAPSFAMIPLLAQMNGLRLRTVALGIEPALDVGGLLEGQPRVVYLCSPNNPTGTVIPRATIEAVLAGSKGIVIVDEAYVEFSGGGVADLVATNDRLLVVRTLSKAFGLAGLRVGYAVGHPALVQEVEKSRGPYKVSVAAESAAIAALTDDRAWVDAHVALAIAQREALTEALRSRGIEVLPSRANFVLAAIADAASVARRMRALGVAVRAFDGLNYPSPGLIASGGSALRISVGPSDEIAAALAALDAARPTCA